MPLVASAGMVRIMVPKNGGEHLIARIVYTGPVPAPVKEGQPIGALKVWRGDDLVLQTPLKAAGNSRQGQSAAARLRRRDRIDHLAVPRRG